MQPYVLAPSELSHERAAWLWLPRVTQMLMALLRNSAGGPQSTVPNPNRAFAEVFKEGKAVLTAIYLPSQSTGFVLVYLTLQWSECVYVEGAGHLHFNFFFFFLLEHNLLVYLGTLSSLCTLKLLCWSKLELCDFFHSVPGVQIWNRNLTDFKSIDATIP